MNEAVMRKQSTAVNCHDKPAPRAQNHIIQDKTIQSIRKVEDKVFETQMNLAGRENTSVEFNLNSTLLCSDACTCPDSEGQICSQCAEESAAVRAHTAESTEVARAQHADGILNETEDVNATGAAIKNGNTNRSYWTGRWSEWIRTKVIKDAIKTKDDRS